MFTVWSYLFLFDKQIVTMKCLLYLKIADANCLLPVMLRNKIVLKHFYLTAGFTIACKVYFYSFVIISFAVHLFPMEK